MTTSKIEQIRTLNDRLRQNLSTGIGTAVITTGVAALGVEAVAMIVKTIAVYDDFCHENDPYEEHDFGVFEADGQTIFFKIDYYDTTLTWHSTDPAETHRVITIMLAEEY
jgi:benzoyl-CoA reductase/2-hydroxyglutaryl-CoA dehydratase subunit BcrC/BadD/HgdB